MKRDESDSINQLILDESRSFLYFGVFARFFEGCEILSP